MSTADAIWQEGVERIGSPSWLDDGQQLVPVELSHRSGSVRNLRRVLTWVDVFALAASWALALFAVNPPWLAADPIRTAFTVVGALVSSLWLLSSLGLYRTRVCAVRSVEVAKLSRVAGVSGVIPLVAPALGLTRHVPLALAVAVTQFVTLTVGRGLFAAWLRRERSEGRLLRTVIVVGTGHDAVELCRRLACRPELGLRVAGIVGDHRHIDEPGSPIPWLGPTHNAVLAARTCGATGAIVVMSDASSAERTSVVNALIDVGLHVQVSLGLTGLDHRRLRSAPLDREPLVYVERLCLRLRHRVAKRSLDMVVAAIGLVLTLPVLALAAVAIKLNDHGPILFRQDRVGKDGRHFTVYKLRTMVPGAEHQLRDLRNRNQREGPLFKLADDPRVTTVGRFLRRTSIDELPQLVNVIGGKMSLVGPRPALPSEVEQFDTELLGRLQMLPGITGLWQIEARDDKSFESYRRLDLFYVQNWSLVLDLVILTGTASVLVSRTRRALRPAVPPTAGALAILD